MKAQFQKNRFLNFRLNKLHLSVCKILREAVRARFFFGISLWAKRKGYRLTIDSDRRTSIVWQGRSAFSLSIVNHKVVSVINAKEGPNAGFLSGLV